MGLLDKILGRDKKAAGDMAQEREGATEDSAAKHEELTAEQQRQAAEPHANDENA